MNFFLFKEMNIIIVQLVDFNLAVKISMVYLACMGSVEINTKRMLALEFFVILSQLRVWFVPN